MAVINIPDKNETISEFTKIMEYFNKRGVFCDKWDAGVSLQKDAGQDEILKAYDHALKPFMEKGGYKTADVVCVNSETQGIDVIKQKFVKEHTHSDDEVRFMVAGHGIFWFNLGGDEPVFSLFCDAGVIISVPANTKHWFDMGDKPYVKAIRIFTNEEGWAANYTESGIEKKYGSGAK